MDTQLLAQLFLIGWASLSAFAWFKLAADDSLYERITITILFPFLVCSMIAGAIVLFYILYLLIRTSLGLGG